MPAGDYPIVWMVEEWAWGLREVYPGTLEIDVAARIKNTSDVAAEPDIHFFARDASGQWIGRNDCVNNGSIAPDSYGECEGRIGLQDMEFGRVEDVCADEVLVASFEITHQDPPTPTPTPIPVHETGLPLVLK